MEVVPYSRSRDSTALECFAAGRVAALFATCSGRLPLHVPVQAAMRGAKSWATRGGGTLLDLFAAVSVAVRDAGERAERGDWSESDGVGSTLDPASTAADVGIDACAVQVGGKVVEFAAVGRAAVMQWTDSGLVPLHPLDNLAATRPDPASAPALLHQLGVGRLGDAALPAIRQGVVAFDHPLILLSPAIAIAVVSMGARPPAGLLEADLAAWLLDRIPTEGIPPQTQGMVLVVRPP